MVETERKYLGRWDIAQAAEAGGAQHIYGPNDSTTPCQVCYQLASPVKCRLLWLKFTLKPSAQTVPDLFSFDERPGVSQGGLPFLHAKRILVLGGQFLEEDNFSLDASMERMSLKNMLEAPTRMSRLRVSYIYFFENLFGEGRHGVLYFPIFLFEKEHLIETMSGLHFCSYSFVFVTLYISRSRADGSVSEFRF